MLITHNAINLERPSFKSRSIVEENKKNGMNLTKHESIVLKKIKHELHLDENQIPKKKKKKSGINPLSIKKKTKIKLSENQFISHHSMKKKRRRTRQIRMSTHLKEHLKELQKNFSIKQFLHLK
jgi:hypothetical protein